MIRQLSGIALFIVVSTNQVLSADHPAPDLTEVQVWGASLTSADAGYTSPSSVLQQDDMAVINAATTEDLVKYEPSIVIRRRFIGDSNGTLGLRGANMFQSSRSMVFADGVPLHYFLESRWSGAPRWTMVSASEIEKVELLYGPFSAEYSGNAMGGVVLIETGIPQEQKFHFNLSTFHQQFAAYDFDDSLFGYKGFASYGNKVGDFSYYLSFNHLDNDAQPQSYYGSSFTPGAAAADNATGGSAGSDARNRPVYWYGDSGLVDTSTDNYKLKLGYDFGRWQSLLNVAFEDRSSENTGQTYIRDLSGASIWRGDDIVIAGNTFSFDSGRFAPSQLDRNSLSIGIRVKGELTDKVRLEANINQFNIQKDRQKSAELHPEDPLYSGSGEITDYDNSGWRTGEVKVSVQDVLVDGVEWISGLRHEKYELNVDLLSSPDYANGVLGDFKSRFGGTTEIQAAFTQVNWDINELIDAAFGLRYEQFNSDGGYYSDDDPATPEFDLVTIPEKEESKTSPKLSIGIKPNSDWLVRYSLAKAYRFPIVEELFRQYQAFNSINQSNPNLQPEDGLHQNLMVERTLASGYLRVNVFRDEIDHAIESQSTTIVGGVNDGVSVSTFVPLDETQTDGIEFIANQYDMFVTGLDVRFNVTYTDASIVKNSANESWQGNQYPRMPYWRANILANYHINAKWDMGGSIQYASDSFGRVQNDDTINHVYGAQDAYTRLGFKTSYALTEQLKTSFGIDNISNDIAYVAHPWPGRTFYLTLSYEN